MLCCGIESLTELSLVSVHMKLGIVATPFSLGEKIEKRFIIPRMFSDLAIRLRLPKFLR